MSAALSSLREWLRSPRERPLILAPSLSDVYPDDLPLALRRAPHTIVDMQRALVDAGAELGAAPTAGTTAPALLATGQAYRAAALTAAAVDLTRDAVLAAGRPAAVIGEVKASPGARARLEARTHVERLATAGIDGVLVLADDEATTRDIVDVAGEHRVPSVIEVDTTRVAEIAQALTMASAIVLRSDDPRAIAWTVEDLRARLPSTPLGARIVTAGEDAQLSVARAWDALALLSLAIVGVAGEAAVRALPALVDLARAPRASMPA